MDITVIGIITIALSGLCFLFAPQHLVWVLSATAPFTRTAAVTIDGNGIPPFYIVAILSTVLAVFNWIRGVRVGLNAGRLLAAFMVVALLVTAISPTFFAGILVLDPRAGIDDAVAAPSPLAYSTSVLAQAVYLVFACGAVLFIAQRRTLPSGVITPAIAIGTILSAARLLPGGPEVLDPIFRSYGAATFATQTRHFGIFFEPSYLAVFSVAAVAYCVYRFVIVRGTRRLAIIAIGVLAIINLALSGTGTAAAAVVLLLMLAVVVYGSGFLFRRMKVPPVAMLLPVALVALLGIPNPIRDAVQDVITGKLTTTSFISRSTANEFSIGVLIDTFGLGSGLGTNRPSSFAALVLSTTGVIGFLLLLVFFWKVVGRVLLIPAWRPVGAALVALLAAKVVAEPDLTTPLMWLVAGVCLYAIRTANHESDQPLIEGDRDGSGIIEPSAPRRLGSNTTIRATQTID